MVRRRENDEMTLANLDLMNHFSAMCAENDRFYIASPDLDLDSKVIQAHNAENRETDVDAEIVLQVSNYAK